MARATKAKASRVAPAPESALVVTAPTAVVVRETVGAPVVAERAVPLRVVARLDNAIASVPRLDALLAAMVCLRAGVEPCFVAADCSPVAIPLAMEPEGRLHLCSDPVFAVEAYEVRHRNRRFPMLEAQMLAAPSLRSINVTGGPTKSFRIPYQDMHLSGDRIEWLAVGDPDAVRDLLSLVDYLGKQRGTGHGRVREWVVETVSDPWPGFPLVRDGKPLRPLPWGWPGLVGPRLGFAVPSYPYWDQTKRQPCAMPDGVAPC